MRRDAKRQFEELFKPAPVSFTEAFDIGPGIRPAALLNSWGGRTGRVPPCRSTNDCCRDAYEGLPDRQSV